MSSKKTMAARMKFLAALEPVELVDGTNIPRKALFARVTPSMVRDRALANAR